MPITPNEFLDYSGPVSIDTTQSRTGQKWSQTSPAGQIQKLNMQVQLPAFSINDNYLPGGRRMIGQFNYTAPFDFTFVDALLNQTISNIWIPVFRFRVGVSGTRYFLPNSTVHPPYFQPKYTGQRIKKQFTIEICTISGLQGDSDTFINPTNLIINMSILTLAQQVGDSNVVITPIGGLFTDYQRPYPIVFPLNWNPTQYWNTN